MGQGTKRQCWAGNGGLCQPLMLPHPQGANILINDSGEVRLGECGGEFAEGAWLGA